MRTDSGAGERAVWECHWHGSGLRIRQSQKQCETRVNVTDVFKHVSEPHKQRCMSWSFNDSASLLEYGGEQSKICHSVSQSEPAEVRHEADI